MQLLKIVCAVLILLELGYRWRHLFPVKITLVENPPHFGKEVACIYDTHDQLYTLFSSIIREITIVIMANRWRYVS